MVLWVILIFLFVFFIVIYLLDEKDMATPSSVLVWRIPWTEEPGPYSPWGRKESDTTEQLTYTYEKTVILVEGQK